MKERARPEGALPGGWAPSEPAQDQKLSGDVLHLLGYAIAFCAGGAFSALLALLLS